ncbi:hypothetical protein BDP27DRAFT_1431578 [Rhodocollybia butyracea]|uniref:DUF6532 domain-containing protein n=1 Tax=Rhodocollybia butyracea TaxID=206335 RepID=A0A9P5P6R6_9AGAR|nr:hypothetical protein BDP27DRAFT_1431578 [Rhodocollybia butyracea]
MNIKFILAEVVIQINWMATVVDVDTGCESGFALNSEQFDNLGSGSTARPSSQDFTLLLTVFNISYLPNQPLENVILNILLYLASTVASQGVKKTRSAAAAAANSGPKTRQATAQAVAPKAPGAKAPSKKEVDLKAFALRQKKRLEGAQQAKDEVIASALGLCAPLNVMTKRTMMTMTTLPKSLMDLVTVTLMVMVMANAVFLLLMKRNRAPRMTKIWTVLLTKDPDALLFNETFEGGGSDDEHRQGEHRSNDDDNNDDAVAVAAGMVATTIWTLDVPSNHVSSPPSTPLKKASNRICVRLGLSGSPTSSRSHSSVLSDLLTPPSRRRGGKITEKHFTPNTRRLAILGKRMNCRATATKQPFPTDKHAYNMEILQELANDVDTQQELVSFLAMPEVGSSLTVWQKAREWVPTRFGIPGKMKSTEVKELVAWLMQDGHYKYGEVNIQNKTYNTQLPFGCESIAHILRLEVFATKGGANIEIFREIVNARTIAPTTIVLMLTFIEHALHEYSEGVYRHVEFSDYCQNLAPIWAEDFCSSLYKLILTQSNKEFLLDVEADDLTEVDIKGLESNAVATRGASPLPSSSPPRSSPIRA